CRDSIPASASPPMPAPMTAISGRAGISSLLRSHRGGPGVKSHGGKSRPHHASLPRAATRQIAEAVLLGEGINLVLLVLQDQAETVVERTGVGSERLGAGI